MKDYPSRQKDLISTHCSVIQTFTVYFVVSIEHKVKRYKKYDRAIDFQVLLFKVVKHKGTSIIFGKQSPPDRK